MSCFSWNGRVNSTACWAFSEVKIPRSLREHVNCAFMFALWAVVQ
jgi:hypothetical protein